MQNDWQASLLKSHSFRVRDTGFSFLAEPPAEHEIRQRGEFICDLSHLGFLRVHGDDAVTFANGQLTNDLALLTDTESQISGHCTPKGRLLCIFLIHLDHGDCILQAENGVLATTSERMRRYVLRAKAVLEIDAAMHSFGVVGQAAAAALAGAIGSLPTAPRDARAGPGWTVLCHAANRYQVIGSSADLVPIWQELAKTCPALGSWAWASLDIEQGMPTVYTATSDMFVPQHLNMDIIGGISFKKGCFPGQEIVARMRYLGTLKTRMVSGYVETRHAPAPGDKVYAANTEQSTGLVVDSAPAGDGYDVLCTARLEHIALDNLRMLKPDGAGVRLRSLPYALDDPEQRQA